MGKASPALASFAAGEFAPELEGRTDIEKYAVAAHIQQNFVATKQGPAAFRPGTAYVQTTRIPLLRSWLVKFEFAQTQTYVLEFGDGYVRFFTNHGPLLATGVAAYNGATAYQLGDLALSAGIIYYAKGPTTGNAPPNATFWYPMAPYNGSATTAIYEIPSPYAGADLTDALGQFALQYEQSGDVLYIAGGYATGGATGKGYPPYQLTRFANAPPKWTFSRYLPTDGPFSPEASASPGSAIALGVSATTGSVTVTAYGADVFSPNDVGRLVRLTSQYVTNPTWVGNASWAAGNQCNNNGNNYVALNSATSGVNPPVHTQGTRYDGAGTGGVQWQYLDCGYGVAQITAYTDARHVTAQVLLPFPANVVAINTGNISAITQAAVPTITSSFGSGTLKAGTAAFFFGVAGMTQINQTMATVAADVTFGIAPFNFTITPVNSAAFSAYTSGGTVIFGASVNWQLGAWSETTEWPRSVAFYKDRLFWAGKLYLWGSVPGSYASHTPDFQGLVTPDSAINVLCAGANGASICWLNAALILLIGTEGGEFGLDAANGSGVLSPDNVEVLRQSKWRCRHQPGILVGPTVLYPQASGRKVFAMDYNFYLNRYDSTDQSKYAYHLTVGGITQMAWQQEPWNVLWAARADGTLLSYTYDREDSVTAWCRHNLGGAGAVESLACIQAPDGLRDELWMIVRRTINGASVAMVEYMVKPFEGPRAGQAGDAQSSAWYVDCAAQQVAAVTPGQSTTVVTGLGYLQGMEVAILADGGVQPRQTVPPSGSITVAGAYGTVTVGLPYQGNLVPMRLEGGADIGTAQGKQKKMPIITLRLIDSGGGVVGQLTSATNPLGLTSITLKDTEYIDYNDTTTPLGSPPPLQSGDFLMTFPHRADTDMDSTDLYICIQQNDPLPMNVAAVYPNFQVEEWTT